jgi:hypothetical protein
MINIEEIKKPLQKNGSRLIYQILDGLNWKQLTVKDIDSNIDYITSYLIANEIENKKVLSLSMNCLTSFILESSLLSLGSNISFLDERILQSLDGNHEFDLIIVNDIDKLSSNPILRQFLDKGNEIISITNFQNTSKYKQNVKSIRHIYKLGLLSKKKLDGSLEERLKNIRRSESIEFLNLKGSIQVDIEDLLTIIEKYKDIFYGMNQNEFSSSLYLKPDPFSKVVNYLFLLASKKFTNNNSLAEFMDNANEIMPRSLVIDSESIDYLIEVSINSDIKLKDIFGSKVKRIISSNYTNEPNIKLIRDSGIEIVDVVV